MNQSLCQSTHHDKSNRRLTGNVYRSPEKKNKCEILEIIVPEFPAGIPDNFQDFAFFSQASDKHFQSVDGWICHDV